MASGGLAFTGSLSAFSILTGWVCGIQNEKDHWMGLELSGGAVTSWKSR